MQRYRRIKTIQRQFNKRDWRFLQTQSEPKSVPVQRWDSWALTCIRIWRPHATTHAHVCVHSRIIELVWLTYSAVCLLSITSRPDSKHQSDPHCTVLCCTAPATSLWSTMIYTWGPLQLVWMCPWLSSDSTTTDKWQAVAYTLFWCFSFWQFPVQANLKAQMLKFKHFLFRPQWKANLFW